MTPTKRKRTLTDLWKWLESRFFEINLKLDHILYRMREEDPRVPYVESDDVREDISEQLDDITDI